MLSQKKIQSTTVCVLEKSHHTLSMKHIWRWFVITVGHCFSFKAWKTYSRVTTFSGKAEILNFQFPKGFIFWNSLTLHRSVTQGLCRYTLLLATFNLGPSQPSGCLEGFPCCIYTLNTVVLQQVPEMFSVHARTLSTSAPTTQFPAPLAASQKGSSPVQPRSSVYPMVRPVPGWENHSEESLWFSGGLPWRYRAVAGTGKIEGCALGL